MKKILGLMFFVLAFLAGCKTSDTLEEGKPRILITTDGEVDDMNGFLRFLLYSNEFDIQGLVYSSSQWHYAGDGEGTLFTSGMPNTASRYGERTELRWTGTEWMQDFIDLYAEVYDNLLLHDESYPSPDYLKSLIRVGNIEFEGEMEKVTEGSELIKEILLDDKPGPVYVQAWGGTNTLARALKSIEEKYKGTAHWQDIHTKVSDKAVVYIILDQDVTFKEYILPNWPGIKTIYNRSQPAGFAYSWREIAPEQFHQYMDGNWFRENIKYNRGPLMARYFTYDDGQRVEGDYDVDYHDFNLAPNYVERGHIRYDLISEWDTPAWLNVLDFRVGLRHVDNPGYGGLGGRFVQSQKNPGVWADIWEDVSTVTDYNSFTDEWNSSYPQMRWIPMLQNDFAARAEWCVKDYENANHPPIVKLNHPNELNAGIGDVVKLSGTATDPDGDLLNYLWWQYVEPGTYENKVAIENPKTKEASFVVPSDAASGDTFHIILEVTDSGKNPLTRFQRVVVTVV
ncbi:MAG: DUF1593 domain-containing protein [Cyclobacteriaceae bacterium]|nr:DUF1593 domain-containing protein [Cyclobacteriaceae bacterium]